MKKQTKPTRVRGGAFAQKRAAQSARIAKPAQPAPPATPASAEVKKAIGKITASIVARSARMQRRAAADAKAADLSVFTPYKPPKGVVPKGFRAPKLAMDSAGWGALSPTAFSTSALYSQGWTFMGYATLSELSQIPEYRNVSEILSTEATRQWIKLHAVGDLEEDEKEELAEKILVLEEAIDRFKLKAAVAKMVLDDGFFGRSHLYIDVGRTDDEDELEKTLGNGRDSASKAKVRKDKLEGFRVVEPIWTYPANYDSSDPLKPTWYNPESWFVMGKLVHATRLLKLVSKPVPDVLKPAYAFGGLSLSQLVKPYVDNWLRTRQSVADIIHAFSVMVLSTDLSTSLSADGDQLFNRLALFTNLRDNNGVFAINKDTEDFTNVAAPISGLAELQAQTQEHMSAVSREPLIKLLGITPTGLNASSDGEIRTWEDTVAAYQEAHLSPIVETAIDFIQLSEFGEVDPRIKVRWVPLHTMTAEEEAEIQKARAETHHAYVDMGAVDPEEVRGSLAADEDSPYHGLDVSDVPDPPDQPEPGNVHERVEEDDPAKNEGKTSGKLGAAKKSKTK